MAKTAAEITKGAFERARGRSAAVHFVGLTDGGYAVYSVDSSRDVDSAYTVTVKGDEYRCDCPSETRCACWHRAAVANLRASRRGFGLPADGSTTHDIRGNARLQLQRLLARQMVAA